jgi:rubrerythrin
MKKIALFLVLILAIFASCKKTVESEKRSWDINLKETTELKFEYPSFTNVLNEQIKTAETAMNEALTISDEKLKIQKMADANNLLNAVFVRNLKEIKSLKYSVRTKSTEVRGLKLEYNEMMSSNQAISDGERIVYDSDMKLKNVISSKADADALSGLVLSDLRTAVSSLDRVIAKVKERENLEKKKTEQIAADKAAAEKQKTDAAQPIKCTYCGTLNVPTASKCKSCGAPLTKI